MFSAILGKNLHGMDVPPKSGNPGRPNVFDSVSAIDPRRGAPQCVDPVGVLDLYSALDVGACWGDGVA